MNLQGQNDVSESKLKLSMACMDSASVSFMSSHYLDFSSYRIVLRVCKSSHILEMFGVKIIQEFEFYK